MMTASAAATVPGPSEPAAAPLQPLQARERWGSATEIVDEIRRQNGFPGISLYAQS